MLYLGGFPVVKKSSIDEAYTGLPVWIVDSCVGAGCLCPGRGVAARSSADAWRRALVLKPASATRLQVGRRHARARQDRLRGVYEEAV